MPHSTTRRSYGPALAMAVAVLGALVLLVTAPFQIAQQAVASTKPTVAEQLLADPVKFLGHDAAGTIDLDTFRVLETAPNGDIAFVALTNDDRWVTGIAAPNGGASAFAPSTEQSIEFGTESATGPAYELSVTRIGNNFDHTLTITGEGDGSAQH